MIFDDSVQGWVLERVDTDFVFNLTSTPSNKDSNHLATKYPQLELHTTEGVSDGEDIFARDDDDENGDDDNPYDYRHFMRRRRTSSPEEAFEAPAIPETLPIVEKEKRPARPKPKARPKRERERAKTPPPPKDEDADNEDSDDGVLTIEMDPETRPRRLGADLVRPRSSAPISLRSAASSVSPHRRPDPELEHEHEYENDRVNESESESDEDVEVLNLSSSPPAAPTPGNAEDELEAELAQALESQDVVAEPDPVQAVTRQEESSSESEEE